MDPSTIEQHLEDIVHADTQRQDDRFDLTAGRILAVEAPGRVDFGGSELEAAKLDPLPTTKRDPADSYGWWTLDAGTYLLEHNEALAPQPPEPLLLQPRHALLERGAFHPTPRSHVSHGSRWSSRAPACASRRTPGSPPCSRAER